MPTKVGRLCRLSDIGLTLLVITIALSLSVDAAVGENSS